jgi:aminoglycoside 6'-N-acetyltransferase I
MIATTVCRVEVQSNDVEAYRELRIKLWPMSVQENRRETSQQLAAPGKWAVFLARDNDRNPLGFLEVRMRELAEGASSSPVGFLEGWYVVEGVRRQGVGRKLVEAGEGWARSMGCTEMASNTEIWRTDSIKAHLCLGYTEMERDVNFLKKLT